MKQDSPYIKKRHSVSDGSNGTFFSSSNERNNKTIRQYFQKRKSSSIQTSRFFRFIFSPLVLFLKLFYECLLRGLVFFGFFVGCLFYIICLLSVAMFSLTSIILSCLACWKMDTVLLIFTSRLIKCPNTEQRLHRSPSTCSTATSLTALTPTSSFHTGCNRSASSSSELSDYHQILDRSSKQRQSVEQYHRSFLPAANSRYIPS